MLPSIPYILLSTVAASFFSIYGVIANNDILLIVATIAVPTADVFYNIIKNHIINKKTNISLLVIFLLIAILIPLLIGILSGYILEEIKLKNEDENDFFAIPSDNMKNRVVFSKTNMFFTICIPIVACLFLPYALENNNNTLIIAISIASSFVSPLTTIGLLIGSNKHTSKDYTIRDYIIPLINFLVNLLSIVIISFIMIKYLGFDKKK
jgi:hypothetical protein